MPPALLVTGLGLLLVAALDPRRGGALLPGLLLCGLGALLLRRQGAPLPRAPLAAALALAGFAATAPEFRADSPSYYAWLRSAAWDGDLDFRNEYDTWGFEHARDTATGLMENPHPVGPALVWAPFVGYARLYVELDRAFFGGGWDREGYGAPYLRAAGLGTLLLALLAAVALGRELAAERGRGLAALAVAGTLAASPLLYYALVVPTMSHGLAFAFATLALLALRRLARAPSAGGWAALGAAIGLCALMRWQALLLALSALPLLVREARAGRLRAAHLLAGAAAGCAALVPQLLAWQALFGAPLALPQGAGFFDWTAPRLVDVLVSANHGLLTWSPAVALGLLGLLPLLRVPGLRTVVAGGVLTIAATAWVNGSVVDWTGSDAFGHRRFDVAWPWAAWGMAGVLAAAERVVARRPRLVTAAALGLLVASNAGLVTHFRARLYPGAAPLERVAADHARLLHRIASGALGAAFGDRGRAFAYKVLVGEYVYTHWNPSGTLDLSVLPSSEWRGFSKLRSDGGRVFRWALAPESCVRAPLDVPPDLRLTVTARAPRRLLPQTMVVAVNGVEAARAELSAEWQDVAIDAGPGFLRAGENWICLRFSRRTPGDEPISAAVVRLQLP